MKGKIIYESPPLEINKQNDGITVTKTPSGIKVETYSVNWDVPHMTRYYKNYPKFPNDDTWESWCNWYDYLCHGYTAWRTIKG